MKFSNTFPVHLGLGKSALKRQNFYMHVLGAALGFWLIGQVYERGYVCLYVHCYVHMFISIFIHLLVHLYVCQYVHISVLTLISVSRLFLALFPVSLLRYSLRVLGFKLLKPFLQA